MLLADIAHLRESVERQGCRPFMGEVSVACNLRNLLRSVRVSRAQPVCRPKKI